MGRISNLEILILIEHLVRDERAATFKIPRWGIPRDFKPWISPFNYKPRTGTFPGQPLSMLR